MVMDGLSCDPRVLQKLKEEVLLLKWEKLCKLLEPQRHFIYLRSRRVFTESDEQEILHKVTTVDRSSSFLDKLKKRMNGYDILVDALRNDHVQSFIIDDLDETLRELIRRKGGEYSGNVSMTDAIDEDTSDLPVPGQGNAPELPQ